MVWTQPLILTAYFCWIIVSTPVRKRSVVLRARATRQSYRPARCSSGLSFLFSSSSCSLNRILLIIQQAAATAAQQRSGRYDTPTPSAGSPPIEYRYIAIKKSGTKLAEADCLNGRCLDVPLTVQNFRSDLPTAPVLIAGAVFSTYGTAARTSADWPLRLGHAVSALSGGQKPTTFWQAGTRPPAVSAFIRSTSDQPTVGHSGRVGNLRLASVSRLLPSLRLAGSRDAGMRSMPEKSGITPKERQRLKIKQIGAALYEAGHVSLSEQARVLGLCRGTTWTILRVKHKNTGLSAALINRMLEAPELPPSVRTKILEYVEEKACGHYGHAHSRRRSFMNRLCRNALPNQSADRVG
jgi:hypothetical protein